MTSAMSKPPLRASKGSKYIPRHINTPLTHLTRHRHARPGKCGIDTTRSFEAAKHGVALRTTMFHPRMRVMQKDQNTEGSPTAGQQETDSTPSWASWGLVQKALGLILRVIAASLRRRLTSPNRYLHWFSTRRSPCTDAVRPMDDGGRKLDTQLLDWARPRAGRVRQLI